MFSRMPKSDRDNFQAIIPGVCQKVSYTGTAASSSALAANTTIVQLYATTDCWVKFGTSPTAVANDGASLFLPSGMAIAYGIEKGHKISVIRDSASGDLHVIEGLPLS